VVIDDPVGPTKRETVLIAFKKLQAILKKFLTTSAQRGNGILNLARV
jgi:hypothetical protein